MTDLLAPCKLKNSAQMSQSLIFEFSGAGGTPAYSKLQQTLALAAVAKEFQKPRVQASLKVDINNFTNTVNSVTSNFEKIRRKLGELDAKYRPEIALLPRWMEYLARYRELLWGSRNIATEIALHAEQFDVYIIKAIVGELGPISVEERIEILEFYIQSSDDHKKASELLNEGFAALARDISIFKSELDAFISSCHKCPKIKTEALQIEIRCLRSDLEQINNKLYWLCAAGIGATIAGIVLAVVFPASAPLIIGAALGALTLVAPIINDSFREKAKIEARLTIQEARLSQVSSRGPTHEKLALELQQLSENELTTTIMGLRCLSGIWQNINEDCTLILSYLKRARELQVNTNFETDPDAPIVISSYLESGCSIYKGLIRPLKDYACGISPRSSTY